MYRNALITGASSGIGRHLAVALAKQKTEVVLCARRAVELERVRDDIVALGGRAHICVMDVQKPEAARALILDLDDRLGGLDLIIANAGVGSAGTVRKMSWERMQLMCDVNFIGAIATISALVPRMVTRKKGHLVGVSSLAAFAPPLPGSAIYQATKVGFSAFLAGLRMEVERYGIKVTAVHPGFVKTEMTSENKKMPFVMEVEDAVAAIMKKLPSAPDRIDFPLPMVAVTSASRAIPASLKKIVSQRLRIG